MVAAKPDCTGQRFGRLTVLGKGDRRPNGTQTWKCLCDCGNIVQRNRHTLDRSVIPSCGCEKRERAREMALAREKPSIVGKRFGRLTVLEKTTEVKHVGGHTRGLWACQCDCGNIIKVARGNLEKPSGQRSCGCLRQERKGKPNGNAADFTGRRFGQLIAIERIPGKFKHGHKPVWRCLCDCGQIVERSTQELRQGHARGRHCDSLENHRDWGLHYPPTPEPYPTEAGAIVAKYLKYTQPRAPKFDAREQDKRLDILIRVAWIVVWRRSQGELISEQHELRYITKSLRFARAIVQEQRRVEDGLPSRYTFTRYKRIGGVMTELTSFNEVVSTQGKTQPEAILPIRKKHIKFRRC